LCVVGHNNERLIRSIRWFNLHVCPFRSHFVSTNKNSDIPDREIYYLLLANTICRMRHRIMHWHHSLHLEVVILLRTYAVGEVRPPVEVDREFDRCRLTSFVTLFRRVGRQRRLLDNDRGHLSGVWHDHSGRLALVDDQCIQQHCRVLPFFVVPVWRPAVHRRRSPGNHAKARGDHSSTIYSTTPWVVEV